LHKINICASQKDVTESIKSFGCKIFQISLISIIPEIWYISKIIKQEKSRHFSSELSTHRTVVNQKTRRVVGKRKAGGSCTESGNNIWDSHL